MTFERPKEKYFVTYDYADRPTYNPYYAKEDMQAAHAVGRKEALEDAAKMAAQYGALPNLLDAIRSMK